MGRTSGPQKSYVNDPKGLLLEHVKQENLSETDY